ncbi:MAG: hypothetical protein ACLUV5_00835 [Oscillospiraceae bacterium]
MKKRIIAAVIVAIVSVAAYPFMEQAATAERGYTAFGGEEMLLAFGISLALYILAGGFSRSKKKSSGARFPRFQQRFTSF